MSLDDLTRVLGVLVPLIVMGGFLTAVLACYMHATVWTEPRSLSPVPTQDELEEKARLARYADEHAAWEESYKRATGEDVPESILTLCPGRYVTLSNGRRVSILRLNESLSQPRSGPRNPLPVRRSNPRLRNPRLNV